MRIHGARGYRGYYNKTRLKKILSSVKKQKTKKNFIIFNNVFFPRREKTCKIKQKNIRYAALCDANLLGKMTRRKKNSGLGSGSRVTRYVVDAAGDVFDDAVDDAAYVADDAAGIAEVAAFGGGMKSCCSITSRTKKCKRKRWETI